VSRSLQGPCPLAISTASPAASCGRGIGSLLVAVVVVAAAVGADGAGVVATELLLELATLLSQG
jgi:hypothetical protein